MHKLLLSISMALLFLSSYAQKENNNWIFGGSAFPTAPAVIDFNTGTPTAQTPTSPFYSIEACATVSDNVTGNLLFYSHGETVYNRNNFVMPNGNGLLGCNSSTQGVMIIRKPCTTNFYYLLSVDCIEHNLNNGFRSHLIDMTLDGGNGDIVFGFKNILQYSGKVVEKITATRHSNGKDYWILLHEYQSANFLAFKLDSLGIGITPVISTVGSAHTSASSFPDEGIGAMSFSPSGNKVALVAGRGTMHVIEIFDFNTTTGVVSNPISISANGDDYGVAISPNDLRLYTTTWQGFPLGGKLFQYDLSSGNAGSINGSKRTVATAPSGEAFGALQYDLNNKLYVARPLATSIGVINSPNTFGNGCNYVNNGVNLSSRVSRGGLPNNIIFHPTLCGSTPLPVELSYFSGSTTEEGNIKLDWTTLSEINNSYFEIEKSDDAKNFFYTGTVPGNGTSSSIHHYAFTDRTVKSKYSYYRLKQIDFDGNYEYSNTIVVRSIRDDEKHFVVYYDEALKKICIQKNSSAPENVDFKISDLRGQTIYSSTNNDDLSNGICLSGINLLPGIFVVSFNANNFSESLKLVVPQDK